MVREDGEAQLLPLVDSTRPHPERCRGPRTPGALSEERRDAVLFLVFAALPSARGRRCSGLDQFFSNSFRKRKRPAEKSAALFNFHSRFQPDLSVSAAAEPAAVESTRAAAETAANRRAANVSTTPSKSRSSVVAASIQAPRIIH